MAEHTKEPWAYRPHEHDDWGTVRAPITEQGQWVGGIICQARDPEALDEVTLAKHRAAKTDPWEANARRIVACVNACAGIPDPAAFVQAARGMREALHKLKRTSEMSAGIMRDKRRTGGWEGAEKTANAFARLSRTADEALTSFRAAMGEGQSDD